MPYPAPIEQFLALPVPLQVSIAALGLVAVQQFNKGHIGRVGIVSAAAIVIGAAYPIWGELSQIWKIYTAVAALFALIAAPSYLTKTSLPTEFYKIALLLYGAVPIILVLVLGFPL